MHGVLGRRCGWSKGPTKQLRRAHRAVAGLPSPGCRRPLKTQAAAEPSLLWHGIQKLPSDPLLRTCADRCFITTILLDLIIMLTLFMQGSRRVSHPHCVRPDQFIHSLPHPFLPSSLSPLSFPPSFPSEESNSFPPSSHFPWPARAPERAPHAKSLGSTTKDFANVAFAHSAVRDSVPNPISYRCPLQRSVTRFAPCDCQRAFLSTSVPRNGTSAMAKKSTARMAHDKTVRDGTGRDVPRLDLP